jgi:hypothetical protein
MKFGRSSLGTGDLRLCLLTLQTNKLNEWLLLKARNEIYKIIIIMIKKLRDNIEEKV